MAYQLADIPQPPYGKPIKVALCPEFADLAQAADDKCDMASIGGAEARAIITTLIAYQRTYLTMPTPAVKMYAESRAFKQVDPILRACLRKAGYNHLEWDKQDLAYGSKPGLHTDPVADNGVLLIITSEDQTEFVTAKPQDHHDWGHCFTTGQAEYTSVYDGRDMPRYTPERYTITAMLPCFNGRSAVHTAPDYRHLPQKPARLLGTAMARR